MGNDGEMRGIERGRGGKEGKGNRRKGRSSGGEIKEGRAGSHNNDISVKDTTQNAYSVRS